MVAIFPLLVLPCVKTTNYGSVTKTFAPRLQLWSQGRLDELLLKASAVQYELRETPKNAEIDDYRSSLYQITNDWQCLLIECI